MGRIDPHSYADASQPLVTSAALSLYLDFSSSTILGSALLTLSAPFSGDLLLDTRLLSVAAASDPLTLSPLPFSLPVPAHESDPVLGSPLSVSLSGHSSFLLSFSTSPSSSALQWLPPPLTSSRAHPFVFTQCQPIHARSIFPCHDTPAARIRFSALLNLPKPLSAVMAAAHLARRDPLPGEAASAACPDALWCAPDRVVEHFVMDQPIPPTSSPSLPGRSRRATWARGRASTWRAGPTCSTPPLGSSPGRRR
uniref:Aminopeptidase N-like N-terminal domain-containing protein n=1 Tax=Ananas comosus var. bracteatus TaxID=296719 RepID=A0A6V7NTV1_ANACO|nr:unnamed protein product [Ananas comosus var. bracteatus]